MSSPVDDALVSLFPPFGLELRAGPLTLRVLRDADLPDYAALIQQPIFEDPEAPHVFWWYRAEPETRVREALRFQWRVRAQIEPDSWTLVFGVWADGQLVGTQDVNAQRFAERRTVGSGSWLTRDVHGRGWGKLMRQAMLVLAFDHLGAQRAESAATLGNERSVRVSHGCGYIDNGTEMSTLPGPPNIEQKFLVTPETFRRPEVPVEVDGLTPELLTLLGADRATM